VRTPRRWAFDGVAAYTADPRCLEDVGKAREASFLGLRSGFRVTALSVQEEASQRDELTGSVALVEVGLGGSDGVHSHGVWSFRIVLP
jgi:hypothetical protein